MIAWKPFSIIVDVVSDYRGVSELDLKSAQTRREISQPRFEVCWLVNQLTDMTLPSIGRGLGGRDHTTIKSAIARVEQRMSEDASYAAELNGLKDRAASAIRDWRGVVPEPPQCRIDPRKVAHRVLRPSKKDVRIERDEVVCMAEALVNADAQIAALQAFAKQLQANLSNLT